MYFGVVVLCYLLGSASFGNLVARLKGASIREMGSGNPGATNVGRVLGFKYALVVGGLDLLKGVVAALVAGQLFAETWMVLLCGVAVIVGHNWPVFFSFQGGRGVATTLGFFLVFAPMSALGVLLLALAIILATRIVSLGSMVGGAAIPVYMLITDELRAYAYFGFLVCGMILLRHVPNIKRLLRGEEPRLGDKLRSLSKKQGGPR